MLHDNHTYHEHHHRVLGHGAGDEIVDGVGDGGFGHGSALSAKQVALS